MGFNLCSVWLTAIPAAPPSFSPCLSHPACIVEGAQTKIPLLLLVFYSAAWPEVSRLLGAHSVMLLLSAGRN
jgi:hypothetical protein